MQPQPSLWQNAEGMLQAGDEYVSGAELRNYSHAPGQMVKASVSTGERAGQA